MRQTLFFIVFFGAGLGFLLWLGGGLDDNTPETRQKTALHHDPRLDVAAGDTTSVGPFGVDSTRQLIATARPEPLTWRDPSNQDLVVEIPSFIRWEFRAQEVLPRRVGTSDRLAVLCREVVLLTYREPRTLVEARALRSGDPSPELRSRLIHRAFRATEATAYGRLAASLDKDGPSLKTPVERDTEIRFHGRVVMRDRLEGITVHCEDDAEISVFPKEESVYGTGHFRVLHEGFRINGKGMELRREGGRTKVEIRENPHFKLTGRMVDQSAGGLLAGGDAKGFRPTTIDCRGRFLLRQVESEDGLRVVLEFQKGVLVEQEGGRQLRAEHLTVYARQLHPKPKSDKAPLEIEREEYEFERLIGEQVALYMRPEDAGSKRPIIAMKARRLTYTMPADGIATALLEGHPDIRMRGRMPLADGGQGIGTIRARCSRRAWFGPDRKTALPFGVKIDRMRRVTLEGNARIERIDPRARPYDDVIEGDQIDMTCLALEDPFRRDKQSMPNRPAGVPEVVPLTFVADGHVRVESERLAGTTTRLVGLRLESPQPHIRIGRGGTETHFAFRGIGNNQRLLGASPDTPSTAATPEPKPGRSIAGTAAAEDEGTWVVRSIQANGDVAIRTALGGPTIGIASRMNGEALTYDDTTGVARFVGAPGRPAHLKAESRVAGKLQEIIAPEFTLDRHEGLVTADGGVQSRVYVDLEGGRPGSSQDLVNQAPSRTAQTLDVDTTGRIDVTFVRVGQTMKVRRDAEQTVRINGPFTADLQADGQVYDSLRAEGLTLRMALTSRPEQRAQALPRVAARPASSRPASAAPPRSMPSAPATLSLVKLEARSVTVHLGSGGATRLEATGGVDVDSTLGHVWGERIIYEAGRRLVRVFGTAQRVAEARFGEDGPKSHLRAERFELFIGEKGAERLAAVGLPRRPVIALLARAAAGRPHAFEMIRIRSSKGLSLNEQGLTGDAVEVVRTLRDRAGKLLVNDQGRPAAPVLSLWADHLRVEGRELLSSSNPKIVALIAERRTKDTVVDLGPQGERARVLGDRLRFDMSTQVLTMTGSARRPVQFKSPEAEGDYQQVWVDMKRGTVSVGGGAVIWRNR